MENVEAAKFYDSSNSSCDESDQLEELYGLPKVTNGFVTEDQTTASNNKRKRNGEEPRARLPTRRPDPNVYNRNALLARENRRKKKAHLETLEQSLQECKRVNTVLLEALKRQRKTTRRIDRERQYYKNIVTNRTDIASLVAALNGRLRETAPHAPIASFSLNKTHDMASSPTRDSLYSHSGSSNYEPDYQAFDNFDTFSDNGRVAADPQTIFLQDFNDTSFLDNFLTELEQQPPAITLEDAWNDLLQDKDIGLGSEKLSSETDTDVLTNISNDHCYINQNTDAEETLKGVGICLHLSDGKVSLEFCPTCNWNANQSLPQQLLQEENSAA